MLRLFVHKYEIPVKITKFPAGETGISFDPLYCYAIEKEMNVLITVLFESNDDIINLLQLTDAVRREFSYSKLHIALRMDYFPYARQDRVCNTGESLSAKVMADLINSQNYTNVFISDVHSDVVPALVNNCINSPLVECAHAMPKHCKPGSTILVSPDAGANKKVFAFAREYGYEVVVRADKTRNVSTGEITGTKVFMECITNKDFLILDDICDGGRTFIELAKELSKFTTGNIYLYVTHGIFTKGLEPLIDSHINKVFVSNLMYENAMNSNFVEKV